MAGFGKTSWDDGVEGLVGRTGCLGSSVVLLECAEGEGRILNGLSSSTMSGYIRSDVANGRVAARAMLLSGRAVVLLLLLLLPGVEGESKVRRILGGETSVISSDVPAAESKKLLLRLPLRSRGWEENEPLVPRLVVEVAAEGAVNIELKEFCLVVGGADDSVSVSITEMHQHRIKGSIEEHPLSSTARHMMLDTYGFL